MTYKLYTLDNQFVEETNRYPPSFTGIIVYTDGTKCWYSKGEWHRINGPACEWCSGTKQWFVNNKRHRIGGPAIEWDGETKQWWIGGKRITEEEHNLLHSIMGLKGLI